MTIQEGKPAPDFSLSDTDGKTVRLEDLHGKHVVLYFYPKDDTPGCTKEACGFRDAWAELEALGVLVFGISPDDSDSHQAFTQKYQLPFKLLSDPGKTMLSDYGAWGEKNSYGKLVTGVIRSTVWIDPRGVVHKHWATVAKAETHPEQVLKALRAELGG